MARNRISRSDAIADTQPDAQRRAFLTLAAPVAGAAGLAVALARPEKAASAAAPQPQDDDGGHPTLHRQAYYRRARF